MPTLSGREVDPPRAAGEDALLAELRAICDATAPERLTFGIGDDAAAWRPSRSNLSVITTDALVEDVHFTLAGMSAEDAGYRALAANLSDIAAMGARPILATVALGVNARSTPAWIRGAYAGMAELARAHRCALAGGDITRSPAIVFAITVVGEVRPSNVKRRDGARPGDVIAVGGPLGASRAGLGLVRDHPERRDDPAFAAALARYRRPEPRLAQGRWFGASRNVHALMDCSDGLSTDLGRMCAASGVGAVIDRVPVHPAARAAATAAGDDPEAYALDGGEDFELLAAIEPRAFEYLAGRFRGRFATELLAVGSFVAGGGVRHADGRPVIAGGWDHLRA